MNGNLDIIKFLTTSQDLLKAGHSFVNIHADNEAGCREACSNGHLEIVKFLTKAPELLKAGHTFVDIHTDDEYVFKWACENHRWDVIQFLVFDLKIERSSKIDTVIQYNPEAQELFRVREEQEQIQQSLNESFLMLNNLNLENTQKDEGKPFNSLRI